MFELIILTWDGPSGRYCMAGVDNSKVTGHPMMWAANYVAFPVSPGQSCRLYLSPTGDLLLQDDANRLAWSTNTAGMGVSSLTLLDTGNLILQTGGGSVVWQSFDQTPIFHLVTGMNFRPSMTMISAADVPGATSLVNAPGYYAMHMDQSRVYLTLIKDESSPTAFVYWSSSALSSTVQASYITLDAGGFTLRDSSSNALGLIAATTPIPSSFRSAIRVALLDATSADLLAFFWNNLDWQIFFSSSIGLCGNPTNCAGFSLCNDTNNQCMCPEGFVQNGAGCELQTGFKCGKARAESYKILAVNVSFYPQLSPVIVGSVRECSLLCARSCSCKAALFDPDTSSCSTFTSLGTLKVKKDSDQLLLLKVGIEGGSSHNRAMIIGVSCSVAVFLLCACCCIVLAVLRKRRKEKFKKFVENTKTVIVKNITKMRKPKTSESKT
ncbi:hypothetical protein KP509_03G045100 [Ceratopteris richardii]|uniref:Bulb-type lectin domain-containing protein n=1 Tax=Ceratopteris richardii TaxID=49495 RepID=A0A8T2V6E0_CERRI|nr:hypothetical protein KP509_03G045100 [Ceratopteris richardii]